MAALKQVILVKTKLLLIVLWFHFHMMLQCVTSTVNTQTDMFQVTITLLGSEGSSEPHHLTDEEKRMFERGAVDVFLLTTPFSLGDLHTIRLWHNNSGRHPAW